MSVWTKALKIGQVAGRSNFPIRTADVSKLTYTQPGRYQVAFAGLLSLILVVAAIICTPIASMPLIPVPGFMTAFGAGMVVINLLLAALLLSKGWIESRPDAIRLGTAYLFVGTIFIPLLLSFKDGFVPGTIIGAPASSVWLWSFWHGGFATAIAWYALDVRPFRPLPSLWVVCFCVAGLVVLLSLLATAGIDYLPILLMNGKTFFAGRLEWIPIGLLVLNATALLLCFRLGARTTEQLWVTVAMVAACFDLWLTVHGTNRFALGWYLSKCGSLFTSVLVIVSLLYDIARLYRISVESEARYRLLADHSGDLITLNPSFKGTRSYVSPSSRSVIGYAPDEFAALPTSEFIHPEDYERVAAEFASLNIENPKITSVHRVRHKDGHWIWLDVDFRLTNSGQSDQSVIVRARDVSARQNAEQALATSEARWNFALNSSGQGVWDTDLESGQTFYAAAWKALLGYADDELKTSPSTWLDLMHPDDREAAFQANLDHLEDRAKSFDQEFRMRHKDGRWVWIHDRGKVIRRDDNGRALRMIGIHTDITARRIAEQELRVAKERAEAGMAAKAEFVANMSHELRTPLTGILGVHELLGNDRSLSDTQRRLVHIAGEAGRSLLSIVNDVLDFSKIDAGQMEIEHVAFDLDTVVTSCRDLARESLKNKPVRIVVDSHPAILGHFRGDPTRLRQVLLNLLTNAVKFTARGEITIRVRFTHETGLLRIDVTDSGIGIPADRIGYLFERFSQADATMTRQYGGTGLGLAICKRLVDLMGGGIGVEAPANGGSNFWFELPLTRSARPVLAPTPSMVDIRTSGRRLLLAEDNNANAEIIGAMLEAQGHSVSIVPNGTSAVEARRQEAGFDLILMDLQMPVMDGLSATRAIRRYESDAGAPRTPIVGLTANAMVEDLERCLVAGMDAHVAKPIQWAKLFSTLDRLLGSADRLLPDAIDDTNLTAILELRKLEELAVLLGRDRLAGMLIRFIEDLSSKTALAGSGGTDGLSYQMHTLISTSGQLGFTELSALCAEIDHQARDGGGFNRLEDLKRASERAIEAVSRSGFAKVA